MGADLSQTHGDFVPFKNASKVFLERIVLVHWVFCGMFHIVFFSGMEEGGSEGRGGRRGRGGKAQNGDGKLSTKGLSQISPPAKRI